MGKINDYLPPDRAARELVRIMERRGYNFDSSASDRRTIERLPEYIDALAKVLGWPENYACRVMRIARTARERCGFPVYTDRTMGRA